MVVLLEVSLSAALPIAAVTALSVASALAARGSRSTSSRFRFLEIAEDVTVCDLCGKSDLKCTMVLQELDHEGNEVGPVVYYGRDCGARALGWRLSADRAEKLVRGTARMDYALLYEVWRKATAEVGGGRPGVIPVVDLDGAMVEVWYGSYRPMPGGRPWSRVSKSDSLYWRIP
jgi:hypothetical protein